VSTSANATRPSLPQTFADLRARGQIGVLPFIPAGYPSLETTQALLPALQRGGASAIEIGIPFSDPIADGPTIQEAFNAALLKKIKLKDILAAVAALRGQVSIPLLFMISYSIVFRYGLDKFLANAASAGVDGLILPDLPPPEAQAVCQKVRSAGIDTVLLVSPTTSPDRRQEIASLCSGFLYYMSITGITGERDRLPADLEQNLRQLRQLTQVPVCVGFGISKPEHVAQLKGLADGAIVGSAVVKRIKQHEAQGTRAIADAAEAYCRDLLSPPRSVRA
jgi:tryptophan synthase alpha chain